MPITKEQTPASKDRLSKQELFLLVWIFYFLLFTSACTPKSDDSKHRNNNSLLKATPILEIFSPENQPTDEFWQIQTLTSCHPDDQNDTVLLYHQNLLLAATVEIGELKYYIFTRANYHQQDKVSQLDITPYITALSEVLNKITHDMILAEFPLPSPSLITDPNGNQSQGMPIIVNLTHIENSFVSETCQQPLPKLVNGQFSTTGNKYAWLDLLPEMDSASWKTVAYHELTHLWQSWPRPNSSLLIPLDSEGMATYLEMIENGGISDMTTYLRAQSFSNTLSTFSLDGKYPIVPDIKYSNYYEAALFWAGVAALIEWFGPPANLHISDLSLPQTTLWLERELNATYTKNIAAADAGSEELDTSDRPETDFFLEAYGSILQMNGTQVRKLIGLLGIEQIIMNPDLMAISEPYRKSSNFIRLAADNLPATLAKEDVMGCELRANVFAGSGTADLHQAQLLEVCDNLSVNPLTAISIDSQLSEISMQVTEAGAAAKYQAIILFVDANGDVKATRLFSANYANQSISEKVPDGNQILILQQINQDASAQYDEAEPMVIISGE